ncbi:MAG: hypothetical protein ACRDVZ_16880, partial [Jiangellaceae bacterium]
GLNTPAPAGYVHDVDAFADELARKLRVVADRLASADVDAVARTEVDRFLTSRATAIRGGLRDRLAVRAIDDHTVVRRRLGSIGELRPSGHRVRVLLGDRQLVVPGRLREVLEHVLGQAELRPADLAAWLDPRSRLVLVRRLVVEGLLEVVP